MSVERLSRIIRFAQIAGILFAAHLVLAFVLNMLAHQSLQ
jgi:cell division protein FtsX